MNQEATVGSLKFINQVDSVAGQTQSQVETRMLLDLKNQLLQATATFLEDTTKKLEYAATMRDLGHRMNALCEGKAYTDCC